MRLQSALLLCVSLSAALLASTLSPAGAAATTPAAAAPAAAPPAAAAPAAASHAIPVPAGAVEGEYWEVTNKMVMEGMPMQMPAQTQKMCKPKNAPDDELAKGRDKDCRVTSQKRVGSKFYWEVECTGREKYTGKGEMERTGPDAFRGHMTMTMSEGTMTMDMEGRKVGGACDPYEGIKKVNAAMAKGEADACREAGTSLSDPAPDPRTGFDVGCQTRNKKPFCDGVKAAAPKMLDRSFYRSHARDPGWPKAYALCGLDPRKPLQDNCKAAVAERDMAFIAEFCPEEGKSLADKLCVGDDLTAWRSAGILELCMKYSPRASELIEADRQARGQSAQSPPEQPPQKQDAVSKFKKGVKGLGDLFRKPQP